ncbi:MAG: DUF5131 family protein [Candidatus Paceibacterota bacterium]
MNPAKDTIGWCDYTWNPITGCKRGCSFCYARKNCNHLHRKREGIEFNEIRFYQERLHDPDLKNKPSSIIFADSMSDIEFWPVHTMNVVLDVMESYKQHTFMLLTKEPMAYQGYDFPDNVMQGITITGSEAPERQFFKINYPLVGQLPRPFFSIEPLLGEIKYRIPDKVERVIVGSQTRPNVTPKQEWIESVVKNCRPEQVYWKRNIKPYL